MVRKLQVTTDPKSFDINCRRNNDVKEREILPIKQLEDITYLKLNEIEFESNIRSNYQEKGLNELAESMKIAGQLEPIRVYKGEEKYFIIYGHRRYKAAEIAGLPQLKCIINVSKPTEIEKLYLQIIENEQSESLSAEDREAYIKKLLDQGQSYKQIAENMGKSESWIRECSVAHYVREQNKSAFEEAGVQFTTKEAYLLRNLKEEELETLIDAITTSPENKTEILKEANRRTKKKNSGKRPKNNKNTFSNNEALANTLVSPAIENGTVPSKSNQIILTIFLKENKINIFIENDETVDLSESIKRSLLDLLYNYYGEKGYEKIPD